ncbi:hypothetical protein [Pseudodesulfovibrio cashew]|nr:hypothetical protein [Pseudodesulfovibrio cashew]
MVAVKGTVRVEDLGLTGEEVGRLNRAVESHKTMFTKVALFLDYSGDSRMTDKTVLVMAMILETGGDCEVRSWGRKVSRAELVSQVALYMDKAAIEYERFLKYPDVKKNFRSLYI